MLRFSPYILNALVDVITGGAGMGPDMTESIGYYRSRTKLEQFFLECGVDMQVGASSRVPATLACLRQVAAGHDGDQVLERIVLHVSDPREYIAHPDKGVAVRKHLNAVLESDGLEVTVVGGKALLTERGSTGSLVQPVISKVRLINFDTVETDLQRALKSVATDPEDAVTAACSLVESVCRSILIELGLPLPPRKDIDGLLKAMQDPLGLSPGRSGLPTEIEADVRQVLSGLTSVIKGIGALRTHGGDAHGREKGFQRIDARIARLALHAASSTSLFLIETWERRQHRSLPLHAEAT